MKFTCKKIEHGELVSVNVWIKCECAFMTCATKGDKSMHLCGVDGIVACVPIMLALQ